ncbi:MAG: S41 family peptidase [Desulfobacter sp.]|uniref:S41 family peptidase n=1 Tax=Desulfobacter sp. TaxID=2294 RepID=UPI001B72B43E|nr:S41 family peptidase [Desulfobacter sp.]MBP8829490.1 S41 family peptidase [Desulfobacter sp.]MBP9598710.1 S41 family peptidase [Desulfobacter sp.]MDQ1269061.1 carboxyl-terminal processing protease [Thermodesulfobacteriota bacterium]
MKKMSWAGLMGFWLTAAVIFMLTAGSVHAADEKTYQSLKLFADVLEELENNYVDEVKPEELVHNAIKGMVGNLDPHSSFMPPDAFDELQDDTKGEFSGIGIVITMKDGILTVVSPIEGTPAYEAGITAGDIIVKIDDASTKDMAMWEAVNKMRGPRYEEVKITIIREGASAPLVFTVKRDLIPMTSVRSAMPAPGFGYLRITNFRMNTLDDVIEQLSDLEKQGNGLKGLIIDLRDNPGGLLDQAIRISDLFINEGTIVSIKGRIEKNNQVFKANPNFPERNYPIVTLINGGSASASEIVAGALKDNSRSLILGTTSFGKGSVQTVQPLDEGFGLKYTIARYYTPSGHSIQAKGIEPDITLEPGTVEEVPKDNSDFELLLKEKDLKNSLKPEEDETKNKKKSQKDAEIEKLSKDVQIKRALDILISYGVFSKINGTN